MGTAVWFCLIGETRKGPLTAEELLAVLWTLENPRETPVWREGLDGWSRAGGQVEISSKLPPPLTTSLPQTIPPSTSAEVAPPPTPERQQRTQPRQGEESPRQGHGQPKTRLSFGQLYWRSAFIWSLLAVAGTLINGLEGNRAAWVVLLNLAASFLGVLLLFAPATALIAMAIRAAWRRV
jgi:hypothetical protein